MCVGQVAHLRSHLNSKDGVGRYLRVEMKRCSTEQKQSTDRIGRLTVQLYPSRSIEGTSVMHMNFLLRYLAEHPKVSLGLLHNVIAIADGGSDWSTKGVINLLAYGYLWQHLGLDYLPGDSVFRTWLLLSVQSHREELGLPHPVPCECRTGSGNWKTRFPRKMTKKAGMRSLTTHEQLRIFKDSSLKELKEDQEKQELRKTVRVFSEALHEKAIPTRICAMQ